MASGPASTDDLLAARRITVSAGFDEVAPGEGALARVLAAAEQWNQAARLPGLADDLNPTVLDPARIEAFFDGLGRQSAETLGRLEGRTLHLNGPDLHLDAASPYEAGTIGAGYALDVPDEPPGSLVQAALSTGIAEDRVAEIANRARSAVRLADGEVGELDAAVKAEGLAPDEKRRRIVALGAAKSRRFAAAMAWREAARALAEAAASPGRVNEAREAREAATRYVSPPWIGMRG